MTGKFLQLSTPTAEECISHCPSRRLLEQRANWRTLPTAELLKLQSEIALEIRYRVLGDPVGGLTCSELASEYLRSSPT